jgi:Gly-Xaa carboxypeptidase
MNMQEKALDFLPISSEPETLPKTSRKSKFKTLLNVLILALVAAAVGTAAFRRGLRFGEELSGIGTPDGVCEQEDELLPQKHSQLWTNLTATFGSRDYQSKAITWLSAAVQIPCVWVCCRPCE